MNTDNKDPNEQGDSQELGAAEYHLAIHVQTCYLVEESNPSANRFAFAYTITIQNQGQHAAQLISRRWIITDANSKIEEVRGLGVVGRQPYLGPNQSFEYTSRVIISTPHGSMHGSYLFVGDDDFRFDTPIPEFGLVKPNSLH